MRDRLIKCIFISSSDISRYNRNVSAADGQRHGSRKAVLLNGQHIVGVQCGLVTRVEPSRVEPLFFIQPSRISYSETMKETNIHIEFSNLINSSACNLHAAICHTLLWWALLPKKGRLRFASYSKTVSPCSIIYATKLDCARVPVAAFAIQRDLPTVPVPLSTKKDYEQLPPIGERKCRLPLFLAAMTHDTFRPLPPGVVGV